MDSRCAILCEVLLAIFLPPLGVCLRHGGVLDLLDFDHIGLCSWNYLCSLCNPLYSKMEITCALVCEILLAILLPPLGVCLRNGCCTVEFLICLVLTILGYVPGIIYALYAILFVEREPRRDYYDTLA
uniref:Hydrophobic protein OSR8 n=1 Tax=Solanum lycopersicum TaxID=4081 RepID=A0A3Q7H3I5_SOLLC